MNLFIDIETLPDQSENALENTVVTAPANYKDEKKIKAYMESHQEEAWLKTALKGISGEICTIGWAINDDEVISNCRDHHTSETWLIQHFFDCIAQEIKSGEGEYPKITWIGHNIEFDLRFLKHRSLILGVKPPFIIPADAKHGFDSVFCTMKEWCGYRDYVSLDALCKAFGIEGKSMTGADVWPAWKAGEFQKVVDYNIADVEAVRKVYKRMCWEC